MIAEIILGLILAPVVLLNVAGPIVIYRIQKVPARVKFEKIDEGEFLAARDEAFKSLDQQLKSLGFDYIGSTALPEPHVNAYFSLYSHAKDSTTAMLVTMESKFNSDTYTEFTQLYSDETILDVHNSTNVSTYPKMSFKLTAKFPGITELEELYSIMLKLKASLNNSAEAVAYQPESVFSRLEKHMARESDELVRLGYCKAGINAEGKRVLTLKGAFMITWKIVFPGKYICDLLEKSYSRKLLKKASA